MRKIGQRILIVVLLIGAIGGVIVAKQQREAQMRREYTASHQALPRFLDLGSTTCVPCKAMLKVMEEMKVEYAGKLRVEFIDVTEDKTAANTYGIDSIPTQIIYDANGKELFRHVGFFPKVDVDAKLKALGVL
jgi:thioredoxin 1